jgi:hypothetical protein
MASLHSLGGGLLLLVKRALGCARKRYDIISEMSRLEATDLNSIKQTKQGLYQDVETRLIASLHPGIVHFNPILIFLSLLHEIFGFNNCWICLV